ncbi:MAG: nucleoside-triphosphatase [Bacteroidota bacterium]
MPEVPLYILTGPVQSGKTTSLIKWAQNRNDIYGILTPVVNGKRFFMDAYSREQFPMEAGANEKDTITIGRFTFSKAGFDKAIEIIRKSIDKEGWLIIDEIGPLELRSEGFCDVLKEVLAQRRNKILLVVREGMAGKLKEYFTITDATSIGDITALKKLPG